MLSRYSDSDLLYAYITLITLQEEMRNLKNDLSMMMRRISGARAALNELTEDDEEMALMNLSSLKDKPPSVRVSLRYWCW